MGASIRIIVDKPEVPKGMVLLEDASLLTKGLRDTLARLIQRQLGYQGRTKLRDEAKDLTCVAITGVSEGSGILTCTALPIPNISGRLPVAVAAFDLIKGIRDFENHGKWPSYLIPAIRNRMGNAVRGVLTSESTVSLEVLEDGSSVGCIINPSIGTALEEHEEFQPEEPVELIGRMFDMNVRDNTFRVEAENKKIIAHFREDQFKEVDGLRWKRIYVQGYPKDSACRSIDRIDIREALEDEDEGVKLPHETRMAEKTVAYVTASQAAKAMLELEPQWDSYQALAPSQRTVAWALEFFRDIVGLLLDYGIEVPPPFLVPTTKGGIQFEWLVQDRELELEIPNPEEFHFLAVRGELEKEGVSSRWGAVRLIRWVTTGEIE